MHRNRLFSHSEAIRLPEPPQPAVSPRAFICFPGLTSEQVAGRLWLYQAAFAQAVAVVQPSLPERDLLGVWN